MHLKNRTYIGSRALLCFIVLWYGLVFLDHLLLHLLVLLLLLVLFSS